MFIFSVILNVLLNSRNRQAGFLRVRRKACRAAHAEADRSQCSKEIRWLPGVAIRDEDVCGEQGHAFFPSKQAESARKCMGALFAKPPPALVSWTDRS